MVPVDDVIEWIYGLQVVPLPDDANQTGGWRGSPFLGCPRMDEKGCLGAPLAEHNDTGHITMSYAAMATLLILGDDLSRVHRPGMIAHLKELQAQDGCFFSTSDRTEKDMRFLYCAAAVCTILNDFSAVDSDKMAEYVCNSQAFDGAFGQGPELESHGGSTYCALAAMSLLGRISEVPRRSCLLSWLLQRQAPTGNGYHGFQGRPYKPPDSCYSFWIGGSLEMLGAYNHCDVHKLVEFVGSCANKEHGGFSKLNTITHMPDILHSYMSIAGLAIATHSPGGPELSLLELETNLNISKRASQHMRSLPWHRS
eukprot:TRINITY_DN20029_c0_g1_i5.p1 TRINITY_DN20029_c0_g1~~TRINITY_DN20029_c0_g1_i5.p1  ORF type:complete len:311 (+),score=46.19 TRINITY_DN20029_c0_g1_i5:267-1199(+)